jgi:hypothetical protein
MVTDSTIITSLMEVCKFFSKKLNANGLKEDYRST